MGGRRKKKELQSPEDFERVLGEEISVSTEFDLPLSVLVALEEDGWTPDATRRALDVLRTADLVTQPEPAEIVIALPNTVARDARALERRLREAVPEAKVGITAHRMGDTVTDLLERARAVAEGRSSSREPS
jgi:hypothetical protein